MQVKLLTSWAGNDFSHKYGEIIDLPEEVATAHISAGNAEAVGQPVAAPSDSGDSDVQPQTKKKK